MAKVRYKEPSENFKKATMKAPDSKQRSSLGQDGYVGEFYNFSIELLIPYAKQARKRFDDKQIAELAATIVQNNPNAAAAVAGAIAEAAPEQAAAVATAMAEANPAAAGMVAAVAIWLTG